MYESGSCKSNNHCIDYASMVACTEFNVILCLLFKQF